jgi:2-polyprenyl-6-methoxyphenol hydroxylase-like FAD-dependent oxidoreductase
MQNQNDVLILGAGIGGLTLALSLHQAGIPCRIFEAVPELKPLGVGINLLPHAMREMDELGLVNALSDVAITTQEAAFFNRYGQLIYREPAGRAAGYDWPQFSIHRGDLQSVLLAAVRGRLGEGAVMTDHRVTRVEQDDAGVTAHFTDAAGNALEPARGAVAIACDGLHSAIRRQFHPHEGAPRYSGINMWRGVTRWKPFLTGATMVRAGWFTPGKMVIYPIRERIDADGRQLINWVAEIESPQHLTRRDWNRVGRLEDFLPAFADWTFDWLDVAGMLRAAEVIYEFPMVDQDPLPRWTFGRVTLLGDAAHPMVPRGSNGAVQSIIDARFLAGLLMRDGLTPATLEAYEASRREATSRIVLMNRTNPPDAILREVRDRSGDKPYARIEDVIGRDELAEIANRYRRISGADIESLRTRPSYVQDGRMPAGA